MIEVLPESDNPLFDIRESGIVHTPFQCEVVLFHYIKIGSVIDVKKAINMYLKNGIVMGRLSGNSLRQMKYWAVTCIALAIHYAILGGVDETDAYTISDKYIREIDDCYEIESIIPFLSEKAIELTHIVNNAKCKVCHDKEVKKCLHYININLHKKISVTELADFCGISSDHLNILFKKELGMSPKSYIMKEKLEASKVYIMDNYSNVSICYNLSFCSETHFISCFKKCYGMTPRQYRNSLNY